MLDLTVQEGPALPCNFKTPVPPLECVLPPVLWSVLEWLLYLFSAQILFISAKTLQPPP